MGMFVNTLPLRNQPKGQLAFTDFVKQVQQATVPGFDNQAYPYEALVEDLSIDRDTSRNPLFDAFFTYQNQADGNSFELPGLELDGFGNAFDVAKFDLTLAMAEQPNGLDCSLNYATALFRPETAQRFVGFFTAIVQAVTAKPTVAIQDISLVTEADQAQLLQAFNHTQVPFAEGTVLSIFEQQVAQTPHAVALKHQGGTVTYHELNTQAQQMASYLIDVAGVQPGQAVGVLLQRQVPLVATLYAIMKAGAVYVPIAPTYPEARTLAIIAEANLHCLVTSSTHVPEGVPGHLQIVEAAQAAQYTHTKARLPGVQPASLAYILFTSGSTGKPKGVQVGHRSLHNIIHHLDAQYPLAATDSYLLKTTFTFDVSCAELFGWCLSGGSLTLLPAGHEGDAYSIIDTIEQHQVTHMNFVPSMFSVFLDALTDIDLARIASLKYIFLAGEALPITMVQQFNQLNTNIALENLYGPTEGTIYASGYSTAALTADMHRVPIGKPVSNVQLLVLDARNQLLPIGVAGELCIAGAALALGYHNNPELTARQFVNHPFAEGQKMYRTGDLVRWLPDGTIEYLGRIDDQVKVRGFRIELGEIDSQLRSYPGVKDALVVARQHQDEKHLVAYFVANHVVDVPTLRSTLASQLPEYMVPPYYVQLEAIPLNASGKANRKALPAPAMTTEGDYQAPETELQKQVARLFAEVLQIDIEQVGLSHNFFTLGGHSLKATKLVHAIQRQLKATVALAEVFQHPTVGALATAIERATSQPAVPLGTHGMVLALNTYQASRTNLWLLHDGTGETEGYLALASQLQQFNVLGVRSATLSAVAPLNKTVEEIAADYIDILTEVQPEGPYHLGGWSIGGTMAYEVARQLEAAGQQVAQVVLVDTDIIPAPNAGAAPSLFSIGREAELARGFLSGGQDLLHNGCLSREEVWNSFIDLAEAGYSSKERIKEILPEREIPGFDTLPLREVVRYMNTRRTLLNAATQYQPALSLAARLIYIRAEQTEIESSAKAIASHFNGNITMHAVNATHKNIMVAPAVNALASIIDGLATSNLNRKPNEQTR